MIQSYSPSRPLLTAASGSVPSPTSGYQHKRDRQPNMAFSDILAENCADDASEPSAERAAVFGASAPDDVPIRSKETEDRDAAEQPVERPDLVDADLWASVAPLDSDQPMDEASSTDPRGELVAFPVYASGQVVRPGHPQSGAQQSQKMPNATPKTFNSLTEKASHRTLPGSEQPPPQAKVPNPVMLPGSTLMDGSLTSFQAHSSMAPTVALTASVLPQSNGALLSRTLPAPTGTSPGRLENVQASLIVDAAPVPIAPRAGPITTQSGTNSATQTANRTGSITQPATMSVTRAPTPAAPLTVPFTEQDGTSDMLFFSTEPSDSIAGLPLHSSALSTTLSGAMIARAQAPQVAAQIATAVHQGGGGTTEIALNPEELGRVRMTLTTTESGISVSIMAERPETVDLMRKNLDLLIREFHDLGHDNLSFSFGEQTEQQDETHAQKHNVSGGLSDDPAQHTSTPSQAASARGGLDLKL